jgi:hypothetical protein
MRMRGGPPKAMSAITALGLCNPILPDRQEPAQAPGSEAETPIRARRDVSPCLEGLIEVGGGRSELPGLIGIKFPLPHWHNVPRPTNAASESHNRESPCNRYFVSVLR